MLEGKAVVRETDMPTLMQSHAMELAYKALDLHKFLIVDPLLTISSRNLMKLMVLPGTVLWAKTLDLASRICAEVSFSSMWR